MDEDQEDGHGQFCVPMSDDDISEQSSATSKAPESESKYDLYWQLCDAMEEADFDKFLEKALEEYPIEEELFLSVKGPSGNTLLHVAAGIKTCKCIPEHPLQVIHDKFDNQELSWQRLVAKQNHRKDTALHVAARAGMTIAAALLLDYHDDHGIIKKLNDLGNTALHEAVKNHHYEMTDLLLRRGSRPECPENKERKCPLYLAVEAEKEADEAEKDLVKKIRKLVFKETNKLAILNRLVEEMDDNEIPWYMTQGMSPVHGAVVHQSKDMLQVMLKRKRLFCSRDASCGTPLHLAAYVNYVDGVKFLVKNFASSAFEYDGKGYLPIHVACEMGCLETIRELLQRWPHPEEMLTRDEGQNILHVAAMYGKVRVVKYILKEPEHHEKLINAKDKEGNTPLHVATSHLQPEIVFLLTRRSSANPKLVNNRNLTALDVVVDPEVIDAPFRKEIEATFRKLIDALFHKEICSRNLINDLFRKEIEIDSPFRKLIYGLFRKEIDAPFRKRLMRIILESAKAPRSRDLAICRPHGSRQGKDAEPPPMETLKDTANARMLVATLVATVAFAAGFSVPGGFNGSEPDAGIATLLNKPMYDVFVICNTIAMYSSIVAVVILLWTQIQDSRAVQRALRNARLPLLIALATMSMAFMAGVYVTTSKRTWIAVFTLIVGITGLFVILILYITLLVPLRCNYRPLQLLADYIIIVATSISGSETGRRTTRAAGSSTTDPSTQMVPQLQLPQEPARDAPVPELARYAPVPPEPVPELAPYAPVSHELVPPELVPYAPVCYELVPPELVPDDSPSCAI